MYLHMALGAGQAGVHGCKITTGPHLKVPVNQGQNTALLVLQDKLPCQEATIDGRELALPQEELIVPLPQVPPLPDLPDDAAQQSPDSAGKDVE